MRRLLAVALSACAARSRGVAPTQCSGDDIEALKQLAKSDPVKVAQVLGVSSDDFEAFARSIYDYWASTHPFGAGRLERTAPLPAAGPAPREPAAPIRRTIEPPLSVADEDSDRAWWCVEAGGDFGRCSKTLGDCEATRASLVGPRTRDSCPAGIGQAQCDRIEVDAAALVKGVEQCKHHDHAACFARHHVLDDTTEDFCAPSVRQCKSTRDYTEKKLADDWKVRSECIAK